MASNDVISYDKHIEFTGVLDSFTIYWIYSEIIKYVQEKIPNCSITFIQDRLTKQGKVCLQLFLTLLYFGHVPMLIGRCRRDFKGIGKLWLSYKRFVDTRKDKAFSPCYEVLSNRFQGKILRGEANQDDVDRFAINTWFRVQQYKGDRCKERKRILYNMLHYIPEGVDRSVVEIVFYSKMATTAEFENDIESAKDFASRAKYLSEICYDKTAKVLAHYSYFFLHRRLYLRDKSKFNRNKALEQCTIGCDMFPVPDEDNEFEMYCALLFLLYKAGDYLQITYELEVLDSDPVTNATIRAAEEILKCAHKYISTATPRKKLTYTYCMGRLHHLKLEFENASEYFQNTENLLSQGILDEKEKTNVSRYCRKFEEECSLRSANILPMPMQSPVYGHTDEDWWSERPGNTERILASSELAEFDKEYKENDTIVMVRMEKGDGHHLNGEDLGTLDTTQTRMLQLKDFRSRLIKHYKQMPEIITLNDSLKTVPGKVRTAIIPKFVPANILKDEDQLDGEIFQSLYDWIESLYFDQSKSKELITVKGEPDVISFAYARILKTWIDSIGNEETLLFDDTDHDCYDVVLHCKGLPLHKSHEDVISLVCHYLAEKLEMTPSNFRDKLSCCTNCLILLEDVPSSYLPDFQVESRYSEKSSNEKLSKFSVISANTLLEDLGEQCKIVDFAKKFKARGDIQVTVTLKDENGLTSEDGVELEKWLNGYFADHSSSKNQHNVCFVNMKAETQSEEISITLAPAAHIEIVGLSNCDRSFVVAHDAITLLVLGKSILDLNSSLMGSHTINTLCLCFEHEFKGQKNCHTFDEFITENISASMDKCPHLQRIEVRNLSIGRRMNIKHTIERATIEQMKNDTNIKRTRTTCSFLFWSCLKQFNFEKQDFDFETSKFAKAVILDVICQKVVMSNEDILEAYACEERKNETSRISIVCFTKENVCVPQPEEHAGFPALYKPYDSVSTESAKAEADRNDIEYDYKVYQEELSKIVSLHVDNLFRDHSNLEAVCGSLVKSTKSGIEKSAPCIVLYCRWKGKVPYGENEFPKELKDQNGARGFSTDIREGFFVFGPNGTFLTGGATDWNKELAMGCSIGPDKGECSATLGPFLSVYRTVGTDETKQKEETCFLTVRHMFPSFSDSQLQLQGTKIVQPADGDELVGTQGASNSKTAGERLCGEVLLSRFSNKVDAAVVKINEKRMPTRGNFVEVTKDALHFSGFNDSNFPTFDEGRTMDATTFKVSDNATKRIIKFGKETGLTKGTLYLTNLAVKISECPLCINENGKMTEYVMKEQLKVNSYSGKPFFLCGDSGSAVFLVDENNTLHCIGMAIGFMNDDYSCVVTPIQNILEAFDNDLPQGERLELKTFRFEEMPTDL